MANVEDHIALAEIAISAGIVAAARRDLRLRLAVAAGVVGMLAVAWIVAPPLARAVLAISTPLIVAALVVWRPDARRIAALLRAGGITRHRNGVGLDGVLMPWFGRHLIGVTIGTGAVILATVASLVGPPMSIIVGAAAIAVALAPFWKTTRTTVPPKTMSDIRVGMLCARSGPDADGAPLHVQDIIARAVLDGGDYDAAIDWLRASPHHRQERMVMDAVDRILIAAAPRRVAAGGDPVAGLPDHLVMRALAAAGAAA